MSFKIKIGLIQINSKKNDLEYNFTKARKMIIRAATRGADIICTPECFLDGYAFDSPKFQNPSSYCPAG